MLFQFSLSGGLVLTEFLLSFLQLPSQFLVLSVLSDVHLFGLDFHLGFRVLAGVPQLLLQFFYIMFELVILLMRFSQLYDLGLKLGFHVMVVRTLALKVAYLLFERLALYFVGARLTVRAFKLTNFTALLALFLAKASDLPLELSDVSLKRRQ